MACCSSLLTLVGYASSSQPPFVLAVPPVLGDSPRCTVSLAHDSSPCNPSIHPSFLPSILPSIHLSKQQTVDTDIHTLQMYAHYIDICIILEVCAQNVCLDLSFSSTSPILILSLHALRGDPITTRIIHKLALIIPLLLQSPPRSAGTRPRMPMSASPSSGGDSSLSSTTLPRSLSPRCVPSSPPIANDFRISAP